MRSLIVLAVAALAGARQVPEYGASSGGGGYGGTSGGGGDGYGGTERRCTPYFENMSRDQCESYSDRVCTTSYKESCNNLPINSCTAQVNGKGGRKCFDVNEQRCSLREEVRMQTIQVPVTVQKCQKQTERICDTYYELSSGGGRQQQCVTVSKPQCSSSPRQLNEKVCRTSTTFECDQSYPDQEPGYGGGSDDSYGGSDDAGYGGSSSGSAGGYGGSSGSSDYGQASTTQGYGEQKVQCRRSVDTQCTNIPRTVQVQTCTQRQERVCRDLVNTEPGVQAKQRCRNEEKRVCELVTRQQPKQVKTFSYRKDCQNVPRKVCGDQSAQTLDKVCSQSSYRQCSYSPSEQCNDEPKQHCFKVNYRVKKQRCENVPKATGYGGSGGNTDSYGGSDGGSGY